MKSIYHILLLVGLLSLQNIAWTQNADSVAQRIQATPDNNDKVFAWINAANKHTEKAPQKAFDYIEFALELTIKLDNVRGEAYCYNTLGALYYGLKNYPLSIKNYQKALTLFDGLEGEKGYYNSVKHIGAAYEGNKQLPEAEKYYEQFQTLAEQKNNEEDVAYAISALARVYYMNKDFSQSIEAYDTLIKIEGARNNPSGLIDASNNLGNVYEAINDSTEAFEMYNQSYQMANEIGDIDRANAYYVNTDNYFSNRGNTEQQIEVQQQAIDFNSSNGNKEALNQAYNNIAALNIKAENPQEAIDVLKQNIILSDEIGMLEAKEEALSLMTEAYEQLGDYENAVTTYQNLIRVQDSIQKEKNKHALLANNLASQLDEKDQRIELLQTNIKLSKENIDLLGKRKEEELKNQQLIIYSLLGGIIILILAAILVIRSNTEKRKANMLLELKSLRTQMNPHFIFNSLNSVNSFISKNDERSANKYLSQFSRLMRMVLENSKYDFVSLSSEIDILELYLSLEHLRFENKFDYVFNIDNEIDKEGIEIPPMLIQPFIENSIWHGLRYLDTKGNLSVSIHKENNSLLWVIKDNGIGRKKSTELKTKNQQDRKSTGMKNIEERIRILNTMNNTNMEVSVEDLEQNSGTLVSIRIPFKTID